MYTVYNPDHTGRIGVKVGTHRKVFNPYEDRTNLPQGAQDELEIKFTPEVIELYDQKKTERDAIIEPLPVALTKQQKFDHAHEDTKATIKTIAFFAQNTSLQEVIDKWKEFRN